MSEPLDAACLFMVFILWLVFVVTVAFHRRRGAALCGAPVDKLRAARGGLMDLALTPASQKRSNDED